MTIKLGRPPIDNPKNKKITIRLTENEFNLIEFCSKKLNISKTDVINKGIDMVVKDINSKK